MSGARAPSVASAPWVGLADWRLPCRGVDAVKLAARIGADGLQLDLGGPGRGLWLDAPGNLAAVRGVAEREGLALLAVAGNHLNDIGLHAAPKTFAAQRVASTLRRLLDAATALDAPLALVPSFGRSAIDGPIALRRTTDVLRATATGANARGLTLACETALDVEASCALVDRGGPAGLRLLLDTQNPRDAGLDPVALASALAEHLADQIHLKHDGVAGLRTPLDEGAEAIVAVLAAARAGGSQIRHLVLEQDYRDGDFQRLASDVGWARSHCTSAPSDLIEAHP